MNARLIRRHIAFFSSSFRSVRCVVTDAMEETNVSIQKASKEKREKNEM